MSAIALLLEPSDICIDIGAHAGSWSLPLSRIVPRGRVYAFEALPYYTSVLKKLVTIAGCKNIETFNLAISDRNGSTKLTWADSSGKTLTGNTHIAAPLKETNVQCVEVSTSTLDMWIKGRMENARIAFIKIDVEGAELQVLNGARGIIERDHPVVFLEVVTSCCERYGYTPSAIFKIAESLGYKPYTVRIEGGISLWPAEAGSYSGKGDLLLLPEDRVFPPEFRKLLRYP
jgi:FkbM family methyltransferase